MRDLQALVRSQARLDEVAISDMGITGMTRI